MAPGTPKMEELPQDDMDAQHEVDTEQSTAPTTEDHSKLDPSLRKIIEYNSHPGLMGMTVTPIVWGNVVLFGVLHFMALIGAILGLRAKMNTLLFYIPMGLLSGLGVTGGAHRLWAHRTYKATLPVKIFLMCCNCISMQNDILEWSRDHRVHHKFTETDADPHNAKRGFFFAHIGWLLLKKHPQVLIKGRQIDMSDLRADPVVMFQARHYLKLCAFFTLVFPVFVPWYFWGEDFWVSFFLLFAFRYVTSLHSTWLVNSAAHLWGSRPYDKHMNPSNNRFVSVAALGEGHHNYHHTFPYDYSTSEWGPSINLTTIILDCWAALGLIYDRKQVTQESILRVRKRRGDLSN